MPNALDYANPRIDVPDGPFFLARTDHGVARPTFEATADAVRVRVIRWPVLRHIIRETVTAAVLGVLIVAAMAWAAVPFDSYGVPLKFVGTLLAFCIVVNASTRAAKPRPPDWLVLTRRDASLSLPQQRRSFPASNVVAAAYVEQDGDGELQLTLASDGGGHEVVGVVRGDRRSIAPIAAAVAGALGVPVTEHLFGWPHVV